MNNSEKPACDFRLGGESLVITFRPPAKTYVLSNALCDRFGSVVDFSMHGLRYYCEESPLLVQPDVLVDKSTRCVVGLTFELMSPGILQPRCEQMLRGLDSNSIRLSWGESSPSESFWELPFLDVVWGDTSDCERSFAQLDFGHWAFLYLSRPAHIVSDSSVWVPPDGFVVGRLSGLGSPVSVTHWEPGDLFIDVS